MEDIHYTSQDDIRNIWEGPWGLLVSLRMQLIYSALCIIIYMTQSHLLATRDFGGYDRSSTAVFYINQQLNRQ